jgi:hypothetical protein
LSPGWKAVLIDRFNGELRSGQKSLKIPKADVFGSIRPQPPYEKNSNIFCSSFPGYCVPAIVFMFWC